MNTFIVDGNLTKDAENKTVGDKNVITFTLANNEGTKDKPDTSFFQCKCWSSEKLGNLLTKGTRILAKGRVKIREHEGKYYTDVLVDSYKGITLLGGKAKNNNNDPFAADTEEFEGVPFDDGDMPF